MPDKHGNITVSDVEEVMNGISGQRQAMTFDMQKAYADLHNNGIEIRTTLAAALDEIERLIHLVDETVIQLGACRFVAKHIQNEQAKRIVKLENALVEERAQGIVSGASFCLAGCTEEDVLGEEDECEYGGNCELAVCPNAGWYRKKAKKQLRQEGLL